MPWRQACIDLLDSCDEEVREAVREQLAEIIEYENEMAVIRRTPRPPQITERIVRLAVVGETRMRPPLIIEET